MTPVATIIIAIAVIVVLAAVVLVTSARRSDVRGAGALSRETVKRDKSMKSKKEDISAMVLEFTNLYVKDYGLKLDADLNIPQESVDFAFESYTMAFNQQTIQGTLKKGSPLGFNFITNKTELS